MEPKEPPKNNRWLTWAYKKWQDPNVLSDVPPQKRYRQILQTFADEYRREMEFCGYKIKPHRKYIPAAERKKRKQEKELARLERQREKIKRLKQSKTGELMDSVLSQPKPE